MIFTNYEGGKSMLHNVSTDYAVDSRTRQPSCSTSIDHWHQYNEIYFLTDGCCKAWIEDTCYELTSGGVLFIPAFLPHHFIYEGTAPYTRTILYISTAELEMFFPMEQHRHIDVLFEQRIFYFFKKSIPYLDLLFSKLQLEKYKKDEFSQALTKSYFYDLIVFTLRLSYNNEKNESVADSSVIEIGRIVKHIDLHYAENLSLSSLAEEFALSESSLSRKFKAYTGQNFKEYLNMRRIESSKYYLANTKKPITEIAFLCGYNNSHFFGDTFRQYVGISPGRYRKISYIGG